MKNPYNSQYNYLYLNDLNREIIQNKNEQAKAHLKQMQNKSAVSSAFINAFIVGGKKEKK